MARVWECLKDPSREGLRESSHSSRAGDIGPRFFLSSEWNRGGLFASTILSDFADLLPTVVAGTTQLSCTRLLPMCYQYRDAVLVLLLPDGISVLISLELLLVL